MRSQPPGLSPGHCGYWGFKTGPALQGRVFPGSRWESLHRARMGEWDSGTLLVQQEPSGAPAASGVEVQEEGGVGREAVSVGAG